jgi:hypothetical protein
MLQNPKVAFRDPKLQTCAIERDGVSRQPKPRAGAFAVVYKGFGPNGQDPFALRVFTNESPERRERYEQISDYLKHRKLKCLVTFEYHERAIRSASDGKWYPLILMDWVTGRTIQEWLEIQCQQGNAKAIAAAAERWLEAVNELGQASVAHGDFQQGNIMVTDAGQLKLVDYDCMCVPSLVGRRNLEVGVEPYQHPGRNARTLLSPELDNFSALLIYVALRALAAAPQLWMKYVKQPGYDKLLFRREDFDSPATSTLYAELMQSPEKEVRDLAAQLFAFVRAPISQIPPLSHFANSFGKVEQLLKAQQWEDAVHALNRRGYFNDAPATLQPLIRHAYEFVCRKDAWEDYCRIPQKTTEENDRRLVDAWNETLFAGFEPAERQRVRVSESRKRVGLLDRLTYLIQQTSGKITLPGEQAIVDAASRLPQGYPYSLHARVEKARSRVSAVARLEKAVTEASAEAMIVAAWRAAIESGCEKMVREQCRPRVELAEKRAPLLKKIHDLFREEELPEAERARRLAKLWDERLLADCREAERYRPTYQAAVAGKPQSVQEAGVADRGDIRLEGDRHIFRPETGRKMSQSPAQSPAEMSQSPADAILDALRNGDRSAFCEAFDARLIRAEQKRFDPFRAALAEWVNELILPPERLGTDPGHARPSVAAAEGAEAGCRLSWNWPDPRLVEQFILVVTQRPVGPDQMPQGVPARLRLLLDRKTWDGDGGCRLIRVKADWDECYVVVWAVIDLGFRALVSRPLIVGQLDAKRRRVEDRQAAAEGKERS